MSQRFSQTITFEIIVSTYHQLGLGPEMENVKDSIIKINQDISELGLIDLGQNIQTLMKEINITEQDLESFKGFMSEKLMKSNNESINR
jgi:hypothetical protein